MQMFRKVLLLLGVFSSLILCVQAHVDLTEEILRKIFPQAEAFTARNKTLTSSEARRIISHRPCALESRRAHSRP